jgi:hypothetical protein
LSSFGDWYNESCLLFLLATLKSAFKHLFPAKKPQKSPHLLLAAQKKEQQVNIPETKNDSKEKKSFFFC